MAIVVKVVVALSLHLKFVACSSLASANMGTIASICVRNVVTVVNGLIHQRARARVEVDLLPEETCRRKK